MDFLTSKLLKRQAYAKYILSLKFLKKISIFEAG